ncbi:MAG: nucleotidyl transferase AbiEii/AbiGii toxin family protein [Kineosporiaceae bacterium]
MTHRAASPLTRFQLDVARLFFELAESDGFLLAGGAALAAQGLSERPTQDLDLFTSPHHGSVPAAVAALEAAAHGRGWSVTRVRGADTFARLLVHGDSEEVLVDLAMDSTPQRPPLMSIAGPALDPEELAGRKLVALFDRAEPETSSTSRCSPSDSARPDSSNWPP